MRAYVAAVHIALWMAVTAARNSLFKDFRMDVFRPLNRSVAALAGVLSLFVLPGCGDQGVNEQAAPEPDTAAHYVRVAAVETVESMAPLPFSGTVTASSGATLAFQTQGRVIGREVEVGQMVGKDDVLLVLDNPQLGPALEAADARVGELSTRYAQAQRDLKRVESLHKQGAATTEEREQVAANEQALKAALALARAEQSRARAMLNEAHLKAPFDGQVTAILVEEGQTVSAGQSALVISGENHLELEIGVLARMLPVLSIGQAVPLMLFGEDLGIAGEISRIATASLPGALNRVEIRLPADPRLHAGMTLGVALPSLPRQSVLSVPMRAVVDIGLGAPRVFVLDAGQVHARPVKLQRMLGERVLVSGQIEPEDLVVVAGLSGLRDGQRVERVN